MWEVLLVPFISMGDILQSGEANDPGMRPIIQNIVKSRWRNFGLANQSTPCVWQRIFLLKRRHRVQREIVLCLQFGCYCRNFTATILESRERARGDGNCQTTSMCVWQRHLVGIQFLFILYFYILVLFTQFTAKNGQKKGRTDQLPVLQFNEITVGHSEQGESLGKLGRRRGSFQDVSLVLPLLQVNISVIATCYSVCPRYGRLLGQRVPNIKCSGRGGVFVVAGKTPSELLKARALLPQCRCHVLGPQVALSEGQGPGHRIGLSLPIPRVQAQDRPKRGELLFVQGICCAGRIIC